MNVELDKDALHRATGSLSRAADAFDDAAQGGTPAPGAGLADPIVGAILHELAGAAAGLINSAHAVAATANAAVDATMAADSVAAEQYLQKAGS